MKYLVAWSLCLLFCCPILFAQKLFSYYAEANHSKEFFKKIREKNKEIKTPSSCHLTENDEIYALRVFRNSKKELVKVKISDNRRHQGLLIYFTKKGNHYIGALYAAHNNVPINENKLRSPLKFPPPPPPPSLKYPNSCPDAFCIYYPNRSDLFIVEFYKEYVFGQNRVLCDITDLEAISSITHYKLHLSGNKSYVKTVDAIGSFELVELKEKVYDSLISVSMDPVIILPMDSAEIAEIKIQDSILQSLAISHSDSMAFEHAYYIDYTSKSVFRTSLSWSFGDKDLGNVGLYDSRNKVQKLSDNRLCLRGNHILFNIRPSIFDIFQPVVTFEK